MAIIENVLFCDNCGVEIRGMPLVEGRFHYCCQDCKSGDLCACQAELELAEDGRSYDPGQIGSQ